MTRLAILFASIAIVIGAAFWAGKNWDRAQELRDVIDTKDRLKDADIGTGDPDDDSGWLSEWLLGQSG